MGERVELRRKTDIDKARDRTENTEPQTARERDALQGGTESWG